MLEEKAHGQAEECVPYAREKKRRRPFIRADHGGELHQTTGQRDLTLMIDHGVAAAPSVLFDTVVLAISGTAVDAMKQKAAVMNFILDAYAHLKIIGYRMHRLGRRGAG